MATLTAVELIGMGELIKLMGVSRSRVAQISSRTDFPAPVASLIMGSIWNLDDIRAWAEQRGRVLDFEALAPVVQDDDEGDPHGKRVS
jgi:prophage regulatory protein